MLYLLSPFHKLNQAIYKPCQRLQRNNYIISLHLAGQGYANVGFNNPKNVYTPNMDKLAQDGIILKRHYTFRWCAPTRSALMTGRLPYHVYQQGSHVTRGYTMLPRKLQQVGYETHQVRS